LSRLATAGTSVPVIAERFAAAAVGPRNLTEDYIKFKIFEEKRAKRSPLTQDMRLDAYDFCIAEMNHVINLFFPGLISLGELKLHAGQDLIRG
jgi:hypothetical protein